MTKYIKFAIANSGTLVYRSNGNAYRGLYTLKTSSNGVTTVYGKDGRKIGTVGKGNAKQQKVIDEKDKRNYKKRIEAKKRREVKQAMELLGAGKETATDSYEMWATAKDETAIFPRDSWKKFEISFEQQSKMNFAKALSEGVKDGVISELEAQDYWEAYNSAPTGDAGDDDRNELWADLGTHYDELGYKYLAYD